MTEPGTADDRSEVLVDRFDGLVLLRSSPDALPGPEDITELTAGLSAGRRDPAEATVVVAVADAVPEPLWARLDETLGALRHDGTTTVRLVLGGAGAESGEGPALAQEFADAWGISVVAAEGSTMIVPGGSLFVPNPPGTALGWRLFTPGTEPEPLGPRCPAPAWQAAVARLPAATLTGCVVEQIPAGVMVYPANARPPHAGDLCHAVPVHPEHPVVLVGAAGPGDGAEVPSDDIAALYAALPGAVRGRLRLAPGDHRDLFGTAQDIADALDIEVELLTGLPLLVGTGADGESRDEAWPVVLGPDGRPGWRSYAASVVCRPDSGAGPRPEPRLLRWRPPLPGHEGPGEGAGDGPAGLVPLVPGWAVGVTRSGFGIVPEGGQLPVAGRPVAADQVAVDLDLPGGTPLDESFFLALSHLLSGLGPEVRDLVTLHIPALHAKDARRLRRIAVRYGVRATWSEAAVVPEASGAEPVALSAVDAPEGGGPSAGHGDPVGRIAQAAEAGGHDTAAALATALRRRAHGPRHDAPDVWLRIRQLRARVSAVAGQQAVAAELHRDVALSLLELRGPRDPEVWQEVIDADTCLRAVTDSEEARRLAPSILDLLRRIPGSDHRLRVTERYLVQLGETVPAPGSPNGDAPGP
ncbi:hypothetical protein AB0E08_17820 [Streptomyces sp. NPDC048281]|uniref:hypothetical protein n=1 Tax=Streptomyces sp. NPDC048281 TaxID=3154715 RepID=UPI00343B750C